MPSTKDKSLIHLTQHSLHWLTGVPHPCLEILTISACKGSTNPLLWEASECNHILFECLPFSSFCCISSPSVSWTQLLFLQRAIRTNYATQRKNVGGGLAGDEPVTRSFRWSWESWVNWRIRGQPKDPGGAQKNVIQKEGLNDQLQWMGVSPDYESIVVGSIFNVSVHMQKSKIS